MTVQWYGAPEELATRSSFIAISGVTYRPDHQLNSSDGSSRFRKSTGSGWVTRYRVYAVPAAMFPVNPISRVATVLDEVDKIRPIVSPMRIWAPEAQEGHVAPASVTVDPDTCTVPVPCGGLVMSRPWTW
jgi:hypothetical protein